MFNDKRLVLSIPAEEIEAGAASQIAQVLGVKVMEKMAILPDVHQGYDIPIGSAVVIKDHIWPGAVGMDINCGMCHISTGLTLKELGLDKQPTRVSLLKDLKVVVPTGYHGHKHTIHTFTDFPNCSGDKEVYKNVMEKMLPQLGTLGGGNHFLNIGVDSKGMVGVTLHTGSRRPGHQIASYWMNRVKHDGINFNGLCMYPITSKLGQAYYKDMLWAFDYATKNRELIIEAALSVLGLKFEDYRKNMINETHNHAILVDDNKVLHRKGATPAEKGVLGVIPGNMRDGVFVTEGLGNEKFLCSSSHGAGRAMSRTQAKKRFSLRDIRNEMHEKDIIVDLNKSNVDESPKSYKDVFKVIEQQDGIMVKVLNHFKPKVVHIG